MEEHHYLGYEQPVGEHLKYLVWAHGRPVACLAWSSAPRHLGSRDRYIGWSAEARRRNIRFIAYNTRFLILPWVRVERLASHILGRMAARISEDWQQMYGHPIHFLETFVEPHQHRRRRQHHRPDQRSLRRIPRPNRRRTATAPRHNHGTGHLEGRRPRRDLARTLRTTTPLEPAKHNKRQGKQRLGKAKANLAPQLGRNWNVCNRKRRLLEPKKAIHFV